jgi:hypothetical protein
VAFGLARPQSTWTQLKIKVIKYFGCKNEINENPTVGGVTPCVDLARLGQSGGVVCSSADLGEWREAVVDADVRTVL